MVADASLPLRESNLVFGEGNPDCAVMFVGEAPGMNEDRLRRPFVGRGGQLLDGMMRNIGWKREDVYITNIVKRRPPDNRDPLPEEIAAYKPYLARQIAIIRPPVIVTLGRFAMHYFLPDAKMMRDHGRVFAVPREPFEQAENEGAFRRPGEESPAGDYLIFPVLHPAAALRSPQQMMLLLKEDFKKLPNIIKGDFIPVIATPVFSIGSARKENKNPGKEKQRALF